MLSARVKILIVDDESALRESLSQIFIACGYHVCSAHDGVSALDKMKQGLPNIILSDLNMPGMSGFDFLPIVRRRFPEIHLVAMSGSYIGSEVPTGVTADAFYAKGSGMNALLRIVKDAIGLPGTDLHNGRGFRCSQIASRELPETKGAMGCDL